MGLIDPLKSTPMQKVFPLQQEKPKTETDNLGQSFGSMLKEVNAQQNEANNKIEEMLSGKSKNIPSAMISMQKAEVSMRLLMATKQKVISAYKEIMHMQI